MLADGPARQTLDPSMDHPPRLENGLMNDEKPTVVQWFGGKNNSKGMEICEVKFECDECLFLIIFRNIIQSFSIIS